MQKKQNYNNLQKSINTQSKELLKMSKYTENLLRVISEKAEDANEDDVESLQIRLMYYKAIYGSFICTVAKLGEKAQDLIQTAEDGDPLSERSSLEQFISQADQMIMTAKETFERLEKTERTLKLRSSHSRVFRRELDGRAEYTLLCR